MHKKQHILVIRFSAMGDVAMTVPVLQQALQQNPELEITVVSNAFFAPLFAPLQRCRFHPAYLTGTHKGAAGIYKLFRELLRKNKFDAVADMHGVLRSAMLRSLFSIAGHKTAVIDKGRKEKKALTRKENKILTPLTTTHERYAQVLHSLEINLQLDTTAAVYPRLPSPSFIQQLAPGKKTIGIAPFAQHAEKMYPPDKMKLAVTALANKYHILLLGGGKQEAAVLHQWSKEITGCYTIAGKYTLEEELKIISNLDLMISMDSANMHLASLFNIPVISIWGATHPFAGFYGWGQDTNNIISVDLGCRPCSVFGNKPCWRGDHACMQQITTDEITDKVKTIIKS